MSEKKAHYIGLQAQKDFLKRGERKTVGGNAKLLLLRIELLEEVGE